MARKLPWATEGSKPKPTQKAPPADRRTPASDIRHPAELRPKYEPKIPQDARETKDGVATRQRKRTPSTSPPPGPPEVKPMRAGYDADDIYMMVEDEFQAVAQEFTAHLHAAEYKRLVKEAKNKPSRKLPPKLTSEMSIDSMRRIQKERLKNRQRDALNDITGKVRAAEKGDEKDDEAPDPWTGTGLEGLMSQGDEGKTSLIGLEGTPSHSRAGKEFGRSRSAKANRDGGQTEVDSFAKHFTNKETGQGKIAGAMKNSRKGLDSEDERNSRSNRKHSKYSDVVKRSPAAVVTDLDSTKDIHSKIKRKRSTNTNSLNTQLDFQNSESGSESTIRTPRIVTKPISAADMPQLLHSPSKTVSLTSPSSSSVAAYKKRKLAKAKGKGSEQQKDKKTMLEEVPMFII